LKFLVDVPVAPEVAQWLALRGEDGVHASEIGLARSSDAEVVAEAMRQERIIVTADLDCPRLIALANVAGPSIVLFRGTGWGSAEMIARLDELIEGRSEADFARSIVVVDRERVHRRRLPVT